MFDDIKKYSRMLFFAFYFLFNKNFSIQFKFFFFFMCFLCFVCDVKKSWWANEREETYLPYGWMCLFIFLFVSKPLHIAYGYRVLYFLVFFFTKWWFLFVFQTLREEFFFCIFRWDFYFFVYFFLCFSSPHHHSLLHSLLKNYFFTPIYDRECRKERITEKKRWAALVKGGKK